MLSFVTLSKAPVARTPWKLNINFPKGELLLGNTYGHIPMFGGQGFSLITAPQQVYNTFLSTLDVGALAESQHRRTADDL